MEPCDIWNMDNGTWTFEILFVFVRIDKWKEGNKILHRWDMNTTKNYICINHGDQHACALEVANQFFFERNSNILLKKMNFYVNSHQKFKLLYDNIIIYCKLMTEAACNSKRISTVDSQKLKGCILC